MAKPPAISGAHVADLRRESGVAVTHRCREGFWRRGRGKDKGLCVLAAAEPLPISAPQQLVIAGRGLLPPCG